MRWLRRIKEHAVALHRTDRAQDLIEYALLAALLAFMVIAGLGSVAAQLDSGINKVGKKFKKHVDHGLHKGWYK